MGPKQNHVAVMRSRLSRHAWNSHSVKLCADQSSDNLAKRIASRFSFWDHAVLCLGEHLVYEMVLGNLCEIRDFKMVEWEDESLEVDT
jgi:hypothetical protein